MCSSHDKLKMTISIIAVIAFIMFNGVLAEGTNVCRFPGIPFGGRINSELAEWQMGKPHYLQCSQSKYEAGEHVAYDCFGPGRKYRLEGNNQRVCNENGKWDGDLPQCVENVAYKRGAYLSPHIPAQLLTDGLKTDCLNVSGNSGSFVQLRLGHPYQIKEVDIYFRDDIADISGEVLEIRDSKTSVECQRSTSSLSSNHIRFSCRASETDFVSETIVQFSHSSFSDLCVYEIEAYIDPKTQDCGYPEIPANGKVVDAFRSKNVTYQCLEGFQLVGCSTITCNKGKWSAPAPLCIPSSNRVEMDVDCFAHTNDGFEADNAVIKNANRNNQIENSVSNKTDKQEKHKENDAFDKKVSGVLKNVETDVKELKSAANNLWLVAVLLVLFLILVVCVVFTILYVVKRDLAVKILVRMGIPSKKLQKPPADQENQRLSVVSDSQSSD